MSAQVVGWNGIKTFTYGFPVSVLLPVQSDRAKCREAQLGITSLFLSLSSTVHFVNYLINFKAPEDVPDSRGEIQSILV